MTSKKIIHFTKFLCSILTLLTLILFAWAAHRHAPAIIEWINHLGWMAPLLFIITYSLATILLLPTMVLTLAGGALFGPVYGTVINLLGATAGAACAFLISRHLIYDWFNKTKGKKLNKLIEGVNKKGWLFIAILRLIPIIPFNLVNYGMGITEIKYRTYLITTFIFLIPAEIIYTYCGYAGMDILSNTGPMYKNFWIFFLLISLIVFWVTKQIKHRMYPTSN